MSGPLWHIFEVVVMLLLPLLMAGGLVLVERRLLGQLQDRYGPNRVGIFGEMQVLADAIKLLGKEDWIPPFADRPVFVAAPAIILVVGAGQLRGDPARPPASWSPTSTSGCCSSWPCRRSGVYSVALAGWSSRQQVLAARARCGPPPRCWATRSSWACPCWAWS